MRKAFSLVELSIVLVILGLLTGGILAGQSLIRAAELRSVSSDFQRYVTAIYTFRDKYFALPGDMTNAQSFWGVRAAGTNLVCQQTINVTTGTCNSDGNGQVDVISGDATSAERFLIWQHLAYAGLIEGSYTGASTNAASRVYARAVNVPAGKVSQAIFFPYAPLSGGGYISGHANYFDGSYTTNVLGMSGGDTTIQTLKPEEQWNLDTKMDDGKPATGALFAFKNSGTWSPGCADGNTSSAAYSLTNGGILCNPNLMLR